MNKRDLTLWVKDRLDDTSEATASRAIDAVLNSIKAALETGQTVRLNGFGTFSVRGRKGRIGRNPNTGQRMEFPDHKAVHFRCSRRLKESLNR